MSGLNLKNKGSLDPIDDLIEVVSDLTGEIQVQTDLLAKIARKLEAIDLQEYTAIINKD